jgi:hypothetical protein
MKHLEKFDIEALRRVMPVLGEAEERGTVGGTYYFDSDTGEYLGQLGTGDEMRFTTSQLFNNNSLAEETNIFGLSLQEESRTVRNRFFSHLFAGSYGVGYVNYSSSAGIDATGTFAVNPNNYVWNNYFDAMVTVSHENMHYNNKDYLLGAGTQALFQAELNTYTAHVSHPQFLSTSNQFKTDTVNGIVANAKKVGKTHSEITNLINSLNLNAWWDGHF